MATRLRLHATHTSPAVSLSDTARAYDGVAAAYLEDVQDSSAGLFDFSSTHAVTDRALWTRFDAMLARLWMEGRRTLRILDAGCGPGTWLRRLIVRAHGMGFSAIDARGIDLSPRMIDLAVSRTNVTEDAHIEVRFDVGDISGALDDEEDGSFDIVLCLNGVLNHLGAAQRVHATAALERVCEGEILVTAYSVGGKPSTCLADAYDARQLRQDNERDRLELDLADGRLLTLTSHLFRAAELSALFSNRVVREEVIGLDLFRARFSDNPRWNPSGLDHAGRDAELGRLEQLCAAIPALIDSASQILFHGKTLGDRCSSKTGENCAPLT